MSLASTPGEQKDKNFERILKSLYSLDTANMRQRKLSSHTCGISVSCIVQTSPHSSAKHTSRPRYQNDETSKTREWPKPRLLPGDMVGSGDLTLHPLWLQVVLLQF